MPGQIVGVGIVIHMFGVFVRPYYVMDFETTIDFRCASHPERGGFHQQRQPLITHKGIIMCRLPVSDDGPGDICHDVMLSKRGGHLLAYPGTDVDRRELWRFFLPTRRAFPWEQRAGPAVTTGFLPGTSEIQPAITQQAAGNLRAGKQMERQQEYFGIPEYVAFIPLSRQPFRGDTASLIMGRRHRGQVPDRIIQRHLILRFRRRHFHTSVTPDGFPGIR